MSINTRTVVQILLLFLTPLPAFAYIDPGSGVLLWQGLIAAIGVGLAFVREPWQKLQELVKHFTTRR